MPLVTDFFKFRFPRSIQEGAAKGLMVSFIVNVSYDYFFTPGTFFFPSESELESVHQAESEHSRLITDSYAFFVATGAMLGVIGSFLPAEAEQLDLGEPLLAIPTTVKFPQSMRDSEWPIRDPISLEAMAENDDVVLIRSDGNVYTPYLFSTFQQRYAATKDESGANFRNFNNAAKSISQDVIFVKGLAIMQKLQSEERRVSIASSAMRRR